MEGHICHAHVTWHSENNVIGVCKSTSESLWEDAFMLCKASKKKKRTKFSSYLISKLDSGMFNLVSTAYV